MIFVAPAGFYIVSSSPSSDKDIALERTYKRREQRGVVSHLSRIFFNISVNGRIALFDRNTCGATSRRCHLPAGSRSSSKRSRIIIIHVRDVLESIGTMPFNERVNQVSTRTGYSTGEVHFQSTPRIPYTVYLPRGTRADAAARRRPRARSLLCAYRTKVKRKARSFDFRSETEN